MQATGWAPISSGQDSLEFFKAGTRSSEAVSRPRIQDSWVEDIIDGSSFIFCRNCNSGPWWGSSGEPFRWPAAIPEIKQTNKNRLIRELIMYEKSFEGRKPDARKVLLR